MEFLADGFISNIKTSKIKFQSLWVLNVKLFVCCSEPMSSYYSISTYDSEQHPSGQWNNCSLFV